MKTADTWDVMCHLMGQHGPVRAKTHHCLSSDVGTCSQLHKKWISAEDGWELLFSPHLSPKRKNVNLIFWRMESKSFERNPQEQISLLFSPLVKSCFSKVCQDEIFPMEISIWEGKSGTSYFFTSPSYGPSENTTQGHCHLRSVYAAQVSLQYRLDWVTA